jgi:hypothetical protein
LNAIRWVNSPEQAVLQEKIDILLGKETEYDIYRHT